MSEPARWLDVPSDSSSVERRLLRAGRSIEPRPGAQGRVLAAVLASAGTLGAAGTAAAAGTGAATVAGSAKTGAVGVTGLGVAGLVKWIGIGALSAGALLGSSELLTHNVDRAAVVAPALSHPPTPGPNPTYVAAPPASREQESALDPPDAAQLDAGISKHPPATWIEPEEAIASPVAVIDSGTVVPAGSTSAATPAPATSAPADPGREAREEAAMTLSARQSLQRGDAAGALALLNQAQQRFPQGRMAQEREALAIESLARLGRKNEAAQRAAMFLQWWPSSPYADIVREHAR